MIILISGITFEFGCAMAQKLSVWIKKIAPRRTFAWIPSLYYKL